MPRPAAALLVFLAAALLLTGCKAGPASPHVEPHPSAVAAGQR